MLSFLQMSSQCFREVLWNIITTHQANHSSHAWIATGACNPRSRGCWWVNCFSYLTCNKPLFVINSQLTFDCCSICLCAHLFVFLFYFHQVKEQESSSAAVRSCHAPGFRKRWGEKQRNILIWSVRIVAVRRATAKKRSLQPVVTGSWMIAKPVAGWYYKETRQ